jgi:hypothetical protein
MAESMWCPTVTSTSSSVQAITIEHKLQLLVYAWMWQCNARKPKDERLPSQDGTRRFFLLNLLSGERWELAASYRRLKDAVEVMLENKYGAKASFSDSAFTAECRCIQAQQPPPQRTMPVACTVGAPSLDCVAP